MTLKQGDLGLLETDIARRLLSSRIPARFAYLATDGTPRVLATWFVWTGAVLAMPTFLATLRERREAAQCARERALARGDRALAAGLAAVVRGYDRWLAEPATAPAPVAPGPHLVIRELWQA